VLLPRQQAKLARGAKAEEHAMSQQVSTTIAVLGIDIGKNSFHVVGLGRFRNVPATNISESERADLRSTSLSDV